MQTASQLYMVVLLATYIAQVLQDVHDRSRGNVVMICGGVRIIQWSFALELLVGWVKFCQGLGQGWVICYWVIRQRVVCLLCFLMFKKTNVSLLIEEFDHGSD
eukprot:TRINITY_DN3930_c0_g1_i1.p6 TRINITY_DN3930_c0_g1~~TRINITY_DN3930_c0_g1_i1.p6  ORF type:complete len:103 (-),score=5.00 TRINITY_DN3930_c0_g1_i1:50-358(-)